MGGIELGMKYKDTITGFVGIATVVLIGLCEEHKVKLESKELNSSGYPVTCIFPAARVDRV